MSDEHIHDKNEDNALVPAKRAGDDMYAKMFADTSLALASDVHLSDNSLNFRSDDNQKRFQNAIDGIMNHIMATNATLRELSASNATSPLSNATSPLNIEDIAPVVRQVLASASPDLAERIGLDTDKSDEEVANSLVMRMTLLPLKEGNEIYESIQQHIASNRVPTSGIGM